MESLSWWDVLDTTLCDQVCQWSGAGRWFSPGTPVSSTNKTDRHDIAEILLKVALNIINQTYLDNMAINQLQSINQSINIFEWKRICSGFYRLFIYVLNSVIKLLRGDNRYPIKQFNSATCLCLSQARTWISNHTCRGLFVLSDWRWEMTVRFVGEIVDHHWLNKNVDIKFSAHDAFLK